jgi:hypothetical protein
MVVFLLVAIGPTSYAWAPALTLSRRGCSPSLSSSLVRLSANTKESSSSTSSTSSSTGILKEPTTNTAKDDSSKKDNPLISDFCKGTNAFWKGLVIAPVRNYVAIRPAGTAGSDIFAKLTAAPEVPGIPRPVWLTILGSVPTALGWYGFYKFSVEEELFQYELQEGDGSVSGCGGYGTLFPFVYGVLIGFPLTLLDIPAGDTILQLAGVWILAGQVNLYRRVNELCFEAKEELGLTEPPLYEWWALLPPPLDVAVGLRQVHFLSEYWRVQRKEAYEKDVIAEDLFPFISCPQRFTLKQFCRRPSLWFWFSADWKDFDLEVLKD